MVGVSQVRSISFSVLTVDLLLSKFVEQIRLNYVGVDFQKNRNNAINTTRLSRYPISHRRLYAYALRQ
jgi:hypothetical protein